jgi:hypothetical protein
MSSYMTAEDMVSLMHLRAATRTKTMLWIWQA